MTTLAVISGGLREPSSTRLLAGRVDTAVHKALAAIDMSATSTMIELRPLGRAIMDAMLTGVVAPELEEAFDAVASADGLIAVTPAFNASFSGLFKSFFDVLPEQTLWDMPVLIAATGGTERHSLVLDHALRRCFRICTRSSRRPACTPPPTTSAPKEGPQRSASESTPQPATSPAC